MLTVGIVVGVRAGLLAADAIGADISVTASMPLSITATVTPSPCVLLQASVMP